MAIAFVPAMTSESARAGATVLIVDDEPQNARLLTRILTRAGYGRVISTADSREVVELVEREAPDILLLDLAMPEPNGFAVLEALRDRLGREPALRVVLLTGHEHPSIESKARELGARDVVSKALQRGDLVARLDLVLSGD
jgi:CheY-like chemotaxis protein